MLLAVQPPAGGAGRSMASMKAGSIGLRRAPCNHVLRGRGFALHEPHAAKGEHGDVDREHDIEARRATILDEVEAAKAEAEGGHHHGDAHRGRLARIDEEAKQKIGDPEEGETEDMPCSIMGVFSPLTGIIGSIQAAETIKILLNIGVTLSGRIQLLNGLTMNWRTIKLHKDSACMVCR